MGATKTQAETGPSSIKLNRVKLNLKIKPAIPAEERYKIEDVLKSMGYDVWGSGTDSDLSSCDISFDGIPSEHLFRMSKVVEAI